jgi:acylphosphatase
MKEQVAARRLLISGRVQGVGFRWFAEDCARRIGVTGWVRNLDDGRVEAYVVGTPSQLDHFAARLHKGPPQSEVRGVELIEAVVQQLDSFLTK